MPLPGTPIDEAERRRSWTALPLRVRTAVRRMHRQFGHPSPTVLVQVLHAARALPEYIQASRHFRCDACENTKPKPQSTKVALPKDYVFGRNLGIDVLEVKDIADEPCLCLNILDVGTTFQHVVLLRQGRGSPSSRECLDSFVSLWVGWAGWPQTLSCVRSWRSQSRCFCPYTRSTRSSDPPGRCGEPRANRTSRAPRRLVQGGAEANGRRSRCTGFR